MLSWTRAERPETAFRRNMALTRGHRPHWMEMKTRLPFLLLALVLVAALAACGGGGNSGPVPTDSIAQVGSTPITKATFNGLMAVAFARYKSQGQPTPKIGTPTYTSLRDSAVNFLVQQAELQQEAD